MVSSTDQLLDGLFTSRQPVVLYVHGRGREPRKTARENIIGKLEQQYGIKVLMFNWDAHAFAFSRPVERARASAPNLRETIERLGRYRVSHPDTANVPVSLLVHSMGSITLKPALDGLSLANENGPIFSNILLTESDEDAQSHHEWIELLRAKNTILLTFNKSDGTLKRSNHGTGKSPLGLGPDLSLANNARYLDTTGHVGKAHRLFDKGRLHGNVAICKIFSAMLRGESPTLTSDTIQDTRQERILVPVGFSNKADACFNNVTDSPDDDGDA